MNWNTEIEGFEEYLKLQRGLSDNSIDAYINDIEKLREYLETSPTAVSPEDVTIEHIRGVVEYLNNNNIGSRTQARIISGIRSFFKYLMIEEKIDKDPTELLDGPRMSPKLPEVLTVEEIMSIIDGIDIEKPEGQRNKAIIETLYSCGLRVSELPDLRIPNMFFDSGYIKVEGQGSKERLVPISDRAVKEIKQYLTQYRDNLNISRDSEDILFLNRRGHKLSRVMIFNIIKEVTANIGITKEVSPHTFRHSFATHLVNGGANLKAVQEMLGHESIVTTQLYMHVSDKHLREAIELHPGTKEK